MILTIIRHKTKQQIQKFIVFQGRLAYQGLGNFEKAENAFQTAMQAGSVNVDPAYNLGRLKLALGEKDSALKAFQAARVKLALKGQSTEHVDAFIANITNENN